jgi:chromosome segregation ATPase
MEFSDRLSSLRQLLGQSARPPAEDERLLQLYWNRAELKKELTRLQDERHKLIEQLNKHEATFARHSEQLLQLEEFLGNPETGPHALVYFQLRSLWRASSAKVARFAQQLQQQQADREQRRQVLEFDRARRQQLADFDQRIAGARSRADTMEAELKRKEEKLANMRGFWNYARRRRLSEEIAVERDQWDLAATEVTDLSDDRIALEEKAPPAFERISVDGRRIVNTAVIAYAQQLVVTLSAGGIAVLAKETTTKRVFDMKYGTREECSRLIVVLRDALAIVKNEKDDLSGLKERTDALRAAAAYRSDADTVPLTDSIGTLPVPVAPVSGLETGNKAGVNVLIDDYWDLYQALLQ